MTAARRPGSEEIDRTHLPLVGALEAARGLASRPGSPDFSQLLARRLQAFAGRHGGTESLVQSPPGSWDEVRLPAGGTTELDWEL